MPIYWTIDSRHQFVVVTAEGDVSRADADDYLDAIEGGGALAYRKLYDARAGNVVMNHDEMMEIAVRLRSYHHRPVGRQGRGRGARAGHLGLSRPADQTVHQPGAGAALDRQPDASAMSPSEVRVP
jgi:hypothetical protein